jgi:hypothetical protein
VNVWVKWAWSRTPNVTSNSVVSSGGQGHLVIFITFSGYDPRPSTITRCVRAPNQPTPLSLMLLHGKLSLCRLNFSSALKQSNVVGFVTSPARQQIKKPNFRDQFLQNSVLETKTNFHKAILVLSCCLKSTLLKLNLSYLYLYFVSLDIFQWLHFYYVGRLT